MEVVNLQHKTKFPLIINLWIFELDFCFWPVSFLETYNQYIVDVGSKLMHFNV